MENSEIMQSLKRNAVKEREKAQDDEELIKFVVFMIENTRYAVNADEVREISFNNDLYYVPFLPRYIRGYANRHGQPFTVVDIRLLFENDFLESSTLLILNVANDQLALLITDVDEIIKLPQTDIHPLASNDDTSRYFSSSIAVKDREIFVLNIQTLIERLERDVERA